MDSVMSGELGNEAEGADLIDALGGEEITELPVVAQISALLFVSHKPVGVDRLAEVVGCTEEEVSDALAELESSITPEQFGFSLVEVAGGWQLRSAPEARGVITKLVAPRGKRISRAAAETLAVIAYKQPVARSEIEMIRGVDALPTLKTLLDGKLVRIVGRTEAPGQPVLYGTTEIFLERFGLKDLSELPTVKEVAALAAEPGEAEREEIEEELGE